MCPISWAVTAATSREVVNRIQTARKELDLDYADRIRVRYRAAPELDEAIGAHRDWIAGETLAVELVPGLDGGSQAPREAPVESFEFAFIIEKT